MWYKQRRSSLGSLTDCRRQHESPLGYGCHELMGCSATFSELWCFQKRAQWFPLDLAASETLSHPILFLILCKEEFQMTFTLSSRVWALILVFHCNEVNIAGPWETEAVLFVLNQALHQGTFCFFPTAAPLPLKVGVPKCVDNVGLQSQCVLLVMSVDDREGCVSAYEQASGNVASRLNQSGNVPPSCTPFLI